MMKIFDARCPECSHFLCRVDPEVLEMTVRCSCCGNRMMVRKLSSRYFTIGREGNPREVLAGPLAGQRIREACRACSRRRRSGGCCS